jgi:hypothetical protein
VGNRPLLALRMDDGVLVDGGQRLYRMDRGGRVTASADFARSGVVRGFMRFSAGVRIVTGNFPALTFHPVDPATAGTSGTPLALDFSGRAGQFPVDLQGDFTSEASAPVMWAWWERAYSVAGQPGREVVLRRIDGSGFVGDEVRLAVNGSTTNLRAGAHAGGIVVTWVDVHAIGGYVNRVVMVSNAGTVTADTAWVVPRPAGASGWPALEVVTRETSVWLAWNGPTSASDTLSPHAVLLGATGLPLGVGTDTASLLAATVDAISGATAFDAWWLRVGTGPQTWYATGRDFGFVYADDPVQRYWIDLREVRPPGAALGGELLSAFRIPQDQPLVIPPVVFDDRVLLLTDDAQSVRPTVVWR